MIYRLTHADIHRAPQTAASAWQRDEIPRSLGTGCAEHLCVDDGLSLAYSHYQPHHDLLEESRVERAQPALIITVALEGSSSFQARHGPPLGFRAGHTTVSLTRATEGLRRYRAAQSVRQLRLIAEAPLLERYGLSALLSSPSTHPITEQRFFGASAPAVLAPTQALLHLHAGPHQPLALHRAALALLEAQATALLPAPVATPTPLRAADLARIEQAHALMLTQFGQPWTIASLSAAVGTNTFKLKQGFQARFGTSPHRQLLAIRMEQAWTQLAAGLPVARVADQVGFQHASSFSAAFQRYYGRAPKSVLRATPVAVHG